MALQYYTPGEGPKPTQDDSELNLLRKLALVTYNLANGISSQFAISGIAYFEAEEGNRPLIDDQENTSLKKSANLLFGLTGGS